MKRSNPFGWKTNRQHSKVRLEHPNPNQWGPSAWVGVPREGFTAHQASRVHLLESKEGRQHQPFTLDALPVNGKRR